MSIRRVGSNPFVNQTNLIQTQRRIERVEKHIGAEDTELKSEEEALETLNRLHHAELAELEAERAQKAKEIESLRADLVLRDDYQARAPEELVDLTGGAREAYERDLEELRERQHQVKNLGTSLAQLARASIYERVSREERAAALRAELEQAAAEREAARAAAEQAEAPLDEDIPPPDEEEAAEESGEDMDWMAQELEMLQSGEAEQDGEAGDETGDEADPDEQSLGADLEGEADGEEEYFDPGADSFIASLEDIENLEQGPVEDPHAGGFIASLDDIAHLVPEPEPEAGDAASGSEDVPAEGSAAEAVAEAAEGGGDFVVGEAFTAGEGVFIETTSEPAPEPALALPFDEAPAEVAPSEDVAPEPEAVVALPFDEDIPRES